MRDVTQEYEDQHDHQHQSQSSAGSIAPIARVIPVWQTAHDEQNQNDEEDKSHDRSLSQVLFKQRSPDPQTTVCEQSAARSLARIIRVTTLGVLANFQHPCVFCDIRVLTLW